MKCWSFDPGDHRFTACAMSYFWLEGELGVDDENAPAKAICIVINPPDTIPCEETNWSGITYPNAGTVYPADHDGIASGPSILSLEHDGDWSVGTVLDHLGLELMDGEPEGMPQLPDPTPIFNGEVATKANLPAEPEPSSYFYVQDENAIYGYIWDMIVIGSGCHWENTEWQDEFESILNFKPSKE